MKEKMNNILNLLQKDYEEAELVTYMKTEEETGENVLTLAIEDFIDVENDVFADLFFETVDGFEPVLSFVCDIELWQDIPLENALELLISINAINSYCNIGSFYVSDEDNSLHFKIAAPFSATLSDEKLMEKADFVFGMALQLVEGNFEAIQKIANGEIKFDQDLEDL